MQSFLNYLKVLAAVMPAIVELVRAIERSVPLSGVGADKLQLLKEIVSDLYESLDDAAKKGLSLEALLKVAATLAGCIVQLFNRLGWPLDEPHDAPAAS